MKTPALYGFVSALAGAFLVMILYFTGLHSDPAKLTIAGWIGGVCGLGIGVTCIVLGVKASRADTPADKAFGYGQALWAGTQVAAVSAVLSSIFTYCYYAYINPGLLELMLQDKMAKLEASGASSDKIEKAESAMRMIMSPAPQAIVGVIAGCIFGFVIALIVAAIVQKRAPSGPPPL
jgi:hypothetical protein